jgi:putative FmdB family regulatory protein
MAQYDFVCSDCGHKFEVFVTGFIRDEHKVCPECASSSVRQKFSSFLRNGSASSGSCAPTGSPFG